MNVSDPNPRPSTLNSSQQLDLEPRTDGLSCELVVYDSKIDPQGRRWELQVERRDKLNLRRDDLTETDPALVVTNHYTKDGVFEHRVFTIRSKYMRTAVLKCVREHPGIQHGEHVMTIVDSPYCLLYHLKDLEDYKDKHQSSDARRHVALLLQCLERYIPGGIEPYRKHVESPRSTTELDYDNLWMVFAPGTLAVHSVTGDVSTLSKVKRMRRCECSDSKCRDHQWELQAHHIVLNGEQFIWHTTSLKLKRYRGVRRVSQLEVCPLDYHPQGAEIRAKMISRGQKFSALRGIHHRQYENMAWSMKKNSSQMRLFKGRIMIDMKECLQKGTSIFGDDGNSEVDSYLDPTASEIIELAEDGRPAVSEEDLATCTYKIPGFALSSKRWYYFLVDHVNEVSFNKQAFETLILPPQQKDMLRALVQDSRTSKSWHGNLIRPKSRGLVVLLHGAPGVGKTLTAESLADLTGRPLYMLTPGDLGTDVSDIEDKLASALAQAEHWKALVLLDDADIFVEARKLGGLKRNALVSIFLRLLERFEGFIFLTTNRLESVDRAFLSRIHVAIQYEELDAGARHEVWQSTIAEATSGAVPEALNHTATKGLASHILDGRQIKNCLRTAMAIAEYENASLNVTHIGQAIQALKSHASLSHEPTARGRVSDEEDSQSQHRRSKRRRTNERSEDG